MFEAFPNEEEDRNRLIAFLKSNNMKIKTLVQNQPFLLQPTVDQVDHSIRIEDKDKAKV